MISSLRFQKLPACPNGYNAYDSQCSWGYIRNRKYYEFAMHLDGHTNPYDIDPMLSHKEADEMLRELDKSELLRHDRILEKNISAAILRSTCSGRSQVPSFASTREC